MLCLIAQDILTCEKERFKQRFFCVFTLHNACLSLKDVKEPRGCEVDGNFVSIVSAFFAGFLWYLIKLCRVLLVYKRQIKPKYQECVESIVESSFTAVGFLYANLTVGRGSQSTNKDLLTRLSSLVWTKTLPILP